MTEADLIAIKRILKGVTGEKVTRAALALRYGVSGVQISGIANGRCWGSRTRVRPRCISGLASDFAATSVVT